MSHLRRRDFWPVYSVGCREMAIPELVVWSWSSWEEKRLRDPRNSMAIWSTPQRKTSVQNCHILGMRPYRLRRYCFTLSFKPFPSQPTLLHSRTDFVPNLLMIRIHPSHFLVIQQFDINQPLIHRHHRHPFKSIIRSVTKLIRRIHFLYNNHILNTNTEIAVLVKSGF